MRPPTSFSAATAVAAVAGLFAAAPAMAAQTEASCGQRIDRVAEMVPDLSERPDAPKRMGISEEHIEGALAALDAARIARSAGEAAQCATLVNAAEGMLTAGGWSPKEG